MRTRLRPVVHPLTHAFLLLTACAFAGPAALLSVPGSASSGGALVVASIAAVLGGLQVAGLGVAGACLAGPPGPRRFTLLLAAADLLAIGNAARLALDARWGGLAPELLEALWFAAPLAVWTLAVWPDARAAAPWWGSPLRWTLIGLPVAFLLAALSRIDFRFHTGAPTPTAVTWLLVYAPTLIVLGLALRGWLAFEERRSASPARLARSAAIVWLPAAALGVLVASAPTASLIVSATVTWGSGYQLFPVGLSAAPLGVSFALLGMACAGAVAILVRLRQVGRPVAGLLLALAAVLSGILPTPAGVLGSLLALQLLWTTLTSGAGPP